MLVPQVVQLVGDGPPVVHVKRLHLLHLRLPAALLLVEVLVLRPHRLLVLLDLRAKKERYWKLGKQAEIRNLWCQVLVKVGLHPCHKEKTLAPVSCPRCLLVLLDLRPKRRDVDKVMVVKTMPT